MWGCMRPSQPWRVVHQQHGPSAPRLLPRRVRPLPASRSKQVVTAHARGRIQQPLDTPFESPKRAMPLHDPRPAKRRQSLADATCAPAPGDARATYMRRARNPAPQRQGQGRRDMQGLHLCLRLESLLLLSRPGAKGLGARAGAVRRPGSMPLGGTHWPRVMQMQSLAPDSPRPPEAELLPPSSDTPAVARDHTRWASSSSCRSTGQRERTLRVRVRVALTPGCHGTIKSRLRVPSTSTQRKRG